MRCGQEEQGASLGLKVPWFKFDVMRVVRLHKI
jgi:hypothetical protein